MKRTIQVLTFALMASLAISGCVKEKEFEPAGGEQFIIEASIPDEEMPAKAAFSFPEEGTAALHLAWQDGDAIRVYNHSSEAQNSVFTIQPGFTDHCASFQGVKPAGSVFDIVAPADYTTPEAAEAGNPNLTQNGNNNPAHLVFTAKLGNVQDADLSSITFSDAWVAAHPGTTLSKGAIVKLNIILPEAVTAPETLTFLGLEDNKEVSLNLINVDSSSDKNLVAYIQYGWNDVTIPRRTTLKLNVTDSEGNTYQTTFRTKNSAQTFKAGYVNTIPFTSGTYTEQLFAGGTGTQDNPYLLASAKHLDNMHAENVLKAQERVHFRLLKDIDMQTYLASHRWVPLNSASPYDKIIDFDGAGHTISNFRCSYDFVADDVTLNKPSFFGLLYGTCKDVTFANATITNNYGTCGILGGYVGYNGKKAVVQNVHVTGTVTKNNEGLNDTTAHGDSGVGGIAGRIAFCYMDSCSADVTINCTVQAYVGGLFGIDFGDASRVRNCWSAGVVHGDQRVGGICGGLIRQGTEIVNCYSVATVDALRCGGGIAGHCNLDNNTVGTPETLTPDSVIKGCVAWQTSFATRTKNAPNGDYWSSGAVVAYTARKNYLQDCYRNGSLSFSDYADVFTLYDQPNADPDSPLVLNNPNSTKYTHYYPYHGKASASGKTLSQVAASLGWDSTVWDLGGSTPVLTGLIEAEPPAEIPVSGQPDVEALTIGSNLGRAFPGTTTARGSKSATQDGITWEMTEVAPGIRYFHAAGKVTVSWMDNKQRSQELFVLDYDLSNTDYEVKVVYANPSCVASQVHKAMGAVATINGGYEIASIAVKANTDYSWTKEDSTKENNVLNNILPGSEKVTHYENGSPHSYMPNNTISDTGAYNWKSEGAFYCDGHQGVRIGFDGYDGGATDKYGANTLTKNVKQERLWYRLGTDSEAAFISSAPILDANYVRFGYTFKDRCHNSGSGSSEEPTTHQTGAYPRTAVAIAYPDNDSAPHLLLIVVDGRYADGYGGYGYSAYWLERHIANAFGPKYMLNLDGGGSTTMCVQGLGDATTHVVNYPCDSDSKSSGKTIHNHGGQRARDTFICIIPKVIE